MSNSADKSGNKGTGKSDKPDKSRTYRSTEPMFEGVLSGDGSYMFDDMGGGGLFHTERLVGGHDEEANSNEPGRLTDDEPAAASDSPTESDSTVDAVEGTAESETVDETLLEIDIPASMTEEIEQAAEQSVADKSAPESPVAETLLELDIPVFPESSEVPAEIEAAESPEALSEESSLGEEPGAGESSVIDEPVDATLLELDIPSFEEMPTSDDSTPESEVFEVLEPSEDSEHLEDSQNGAVETDAVYSIEEPESAEESFAVAPGGIDVPDSSDFSGGYSLPPPELLGEEGFAVPSASDFESAAAASPSRTEYSAEPTDDVESFGSEASTLAEIDATTESSSDQHDISLYKDMSITESSEINEAVAESPSAGDDSAALEPVASTGAPKSNKPVSTLTKAWKADGIVPKLPKQPTMRDSSSKIAKMEIPTKPSLPSKPSMKDTGDHKAIKPASTLTKAWKADGIVPKARVGEETGKIKALDADTIKARFAKDAEEVAAAKTPPVVPQPAPARDAFKKPARKIKGIHLVGRLSIFRDIGKEEGGTHSASVVAKTPITRPAPVPQAKPAVKNRPVLKKPPVEPGLKGGLSAHKAGGETAPTTEESEMRSEQSESVRRKFAKDSGGAPPPAARKFDAASLHSKRARIAMIAVAAVFILGVIGYAGALSLLVSQSNAALEKKDYHGAVTAANQALGLYPLSVPARTARGKALYAQGKNLDQALDDLSTAVSSNPDSFELRKARALCAQKAGKYDVSKADVEALLKFNNLPEERAHLYAILATTEYRQGDFKDSLKNYSTAITLGRKLQPVYIGRGWAYLDNNKPDQAKKDFEAAIALNPKTAEACDARFGKSEVLRLQGDTAGAIKVISDSIAMNPKVADYLVQRGKLYLKSNQLEPAFADFSAAVSHDKNAAEGYIGEATVLLKQNNPAKAGKVVDSMPEQSVSTSDLRGERARIYQDKGDFQKAVVEYKKAIDQGGKTPNLYLDAAWCCGKINKYSEAGKLIEKLIAQTPKPVSQYQALHGFYNLLLENYSTAAADLELAIKLDPKNFDAHRWYAEVLSRQDHPISAYEEYKTALSINPHLDDVRQRMAKLSKFVAVHHTTSEPVTQASSNTDESTVVIKGDVGTLVKTGFAKMQGNDVEGAIRYLSAAVKADPNAANARRYLALALFRARQYDQAAAQLNVLHSLNALTFDDSMMLGKCYSLTGRYEDAVRLFEQCLQQSPNSAQAKCDLAEAYAGSGFAQKAKGILTQAIKDDPANAGKYAESMQTVNSGAPNRPTAAPATAPRGKFQAG